MFFVRFLGRIENSNFFFEICWPLVSRHLRSSFPEGGEVWVSYLLLNRKAILRGNNCDSITWRAGTKEKEVIKLVVRQQQHYCNIPGGRKNTLLKTLPVNTLHYITVTLYIYHLRIFQQLPHQTLAWVNWMEISTFLL